MDDRDRSATKTSHRRTLLLIGALLAVVIAGLLVVRAVWHAIETAVTAPEAVWIREAEIEGPRRAPPQHALVLDVTASEPSSVSAQDEEGTRVLTRCSERGDDSKSSCALPARAASFRVWLTGSCRDVPIRQGSMGLWLCDAPPNARVSVRTSIRGAWEATVSERTRLTIPEAIDGVYPDVEVVTVTPSGIEPEVRLRFGRPDGGDIVSNVPWWPATCARPATKDGRTPPSFACRIYAGELSGAKGELDVVAELNALGVCPTTEPCPRPSDAVVRIEAVRVVTR